MVTAFEFALACATVAGSALALWLALEVAMRLLGLIDVWIIRYLARTGGTLPCGCPADSTECT